jgi:hypothetical protein
VSRERLEQERSLSPCDWPYEMDLLQTEKNILGSSISISVLWTRDEEIRLIPDSNTDGGFIRLYSESTSESLDLME